MDEYFKSATLIFVLLNPFMMSVYLIDLIQDLERRIFERVLIRGAVISLVAFLIFSWIGDAVFTKVLQARFASFLIFGGIVFFVIGMKFVFQGADTMKTLRGKAEHLGGSIAMPFMIGPGTVSASILAGSRAGPVWGPLSILSALALVVAGLILLKRIHDFVRSRDERLIERYLDIIGRITALIIGTYAVEMVLQGIEIWLGLSLVGGAG